MTTNPEPAPATAFTPQRPQDVLAADRVAAVVRGSSVADPAGLAAALAAEGVRCVEFTFTIPGVLDVIASAASAEGAVVGAGTVLTADDARAAIDAGARFIVSPGLALDVVEPCHTAGVPFFLGALTPTEVMTAVRAGSAAVKLFPGGLGGPRYLKDLRGPFPEVGFVPSGGITPDTAPEFLAAGALAVFAGSDLVPRSAVETGDLTAVVKRAEAYRAALRASGHLTSR
ncbi:bifunctional 4-hydroxy-2-oxoglutarate aldolase/2-dehydro-3-deoxy-phosphogluconate aldolase [Microbispora sp. H11081]|uniref:bifunctional 4-hydroxy-2-oxoglutarate aldolase/2-dehydro-3-deoxy-phosphogluconate aldolase n=1 Tax=Microbispora sp. H11081 TaxID=2729107 RepID=UPI0014741441|nr:bifunctional 4-hydroxy-2-oxoglutarate aldolase/2-dehydro-3-deoxy-phosphogluconate aldolase [Microbispora sp. H11081]